MSESFNFEYCRCCTCGYEWRKGLNGSHSCAENLQKQLAEAREAVLKYKIKYNNQCCEMLRLKQSKKDQTDLIRKLKEKK